MDYYFFDMENIGRLMPDDVELFRAARTTFCFLGNLTVKIPVSFLSRAQKAGIAMRFIETRRTGKNALDFHISEQVGELVALSGKKDRIAILSGDSGYDSIVEWLGRESGVRIIRAQEAAGAAALFCPGRAGKGRGRKKKEASGQNMPRLARKVLLIMARNINNRQDNAQRARSQIESWARNASAGDVYDYLLGNGYMSEKNGRVMYDLEAIWSELANSPSAVPAMRDLARQVRQVLEMGKKRPRKLATLACKLRLPSGQAGLLARQMVNFGLCMSQGKPESPCFSFDVRLMRAFVRIFDDRQAAAARNGSCNIHELRKQAEI